jgi:hypothetical protein
VGRVYRRCHGSVDLDPERIIRDATNVANEVVQHLTGLPDARVRVAIEIEADLPNGARDSVMHTVTENARMLKFESSSGFEES